MSRMGIRTTLRMEAESKPVQAEVHDEQAAELVFRVCSHRRYAGCVLAMVFLLAAAVSLWHRAGWDVVVELAVLSLFSLAGVLWVRRTELRVSAEGLLSVGDLGGPRRGALRLRWDRVRELHYGPGGGEEMGGLYALEGSWCSRCILPRVTESEAEEVIAAIAKRYPSMLLPSARSTHVAVSWPAPRTKGARTVSVGTVDAR